MRMRLWSEDRDGVSGEWGRFVCVAKRADSSMVMNTPRLEAIYDGNTRSQVSTGSMNLAVQ